MSILCLSVPVLAQDVPMLVSLQANINTVSGEPLNETVPLVEVKLYSDETPQGWSEDHTEVEFINGTAVLELGSVTELTHDIFEIASPNFRLWIEQTPIDPIYLFSVVYALKARSADHVEWDNVEVGETGLTTVTVNATVINVDGLNLDGRTIQSWINDAVPEISESAESAGTADVALSIDWDNIQNRPDGLDDGDDVVTYNAGPGITLSGTTFSLDSQGASLGEVLVFNGSTWVPSKDATTQLVGSNGITVNGTTISLMSGLTWDEENGYLGIASSNPTSELVVEGSILANGLFINGIPVGSSTDSFWNASGSEIYFPNNVGVGISNPDYKLHVIGDLKAEGMFVSDNLKADFFLGDGSGITGLTEDQIDGLGHLATHNLVSDSLVADDAAIAFSKLAISTVNLVDMGFVTGAVTQLDVDAEFVSRGVLASGNNLSELTNTASARLNLGLGALSLVESLRNEDVADDAAISFNKLAITTQNLVDMGFVTGAVKELAIGNLAALSEVDSDTIANESIMDEDIATFAAIAFDKLAITTQNLVDMGFVTGAVKELSVGGLAALSEVDSDTIANESIIDEDIATFAAIAFSKLAISTQNLVDMGFVTSAVTAVDVLDMMNTEGLLVSGNNLNDVQDVALARTNLGLGDTDSPEFSSMSLTDDLEVSGNVTFNKAVSFEQVDKGSISGAQTVDWTSGNKQKIVLTGDSTINFTPPEGATNLMLIVYQDATGGHEVTWGSSAIRWPAGLTPVLSTAGSSIDVITFYFDGTNYLGMGALDFKASL